eukprot:13289432-Ditylum_brightwellii.AAC.1
MTENSDEESIDFYFKDDDAAAKDEKHEAEEDRMLSVKLGSLSLKPKPSPMHKIIEASMPTITSCWTEARTL